MEANNKIKTGTEYGYSTMAVFVTLSVYTVLIILTVIRYSLIEGRTEYVREIASYWLNGYYFLLTLYASGKRFIKDWNDQKMPGQYFVYIFWAMMISMPFCEHHKLFGIQRVSPSLYQIFYVVTAIYAGSEVIKAKKLDWVSKIFDAIIQSITKKASDQ